MRLWIKKFHRHQTFLLQMSCFVRTCILFVIVREIYVVIAFYFSHVATATTTATATATATTATADHRHGIHFFKFQFVQKPHPSIMHRFRILS